MEPTIGIWVADVRETISDAGNVTDLVERASTHDVIVIEVAGLDEPYEVIRGKHLLAKYSDAVRAGRQVHQPSTMRLIVANLAQAITVAAALRSFERAPTDFPRVAQNFAKGLNLAALHADPAADFLDPELHQAWSNAAVIDLWDRQLKIGDGVATIRELAACATVVFRWPDQVDEALHDQREVYVRLTDSTSKLLIIKVTNREQTVALSYVYQVLKQTPAPSRDLMRRWRPT